VDPRIPGGAAAAPQARAAAHALHRHRRGLAGDRAADRQPRSRTARRRSRSRSTRPHSRASCDRRRGRQRPRQARVHSWTPRATSPGRNGSATGHQPPSIAQIGRCSAVRDGRLTRPAVPAGLPRARNLDSGGDGARAAARRVREPDPRARSRWSTTVTLVAVAKRCEHWTCSTKRRRRVWANSGGPGEPPPHRARAREPAARRFLAAAAAAGDPGRSALRQTRAARRGLEALARTGSTTQSCCGSDTPLRSRRCWCASCQRPLGVQVSRGSHDAVLEQALLLGLCTAYQYDPPVPLLWTRASLTRRVELYDLRGSTHEPFEVRGLLAD